MKDFEKLYQENELEIFEKSIYGFEIKNNIFEI